MEKTKLFLTSYQGTSREIRALSKTHPEAILPQLDRLNARQIHTKVGICINLSITHALRVGLNFKLWKFLWGRLNIYFPQLSSNLPQILEIGRPRCWGIAE
ncbi:hypothetical protein CEXT_134041 [Caerostris extrusa]|uniref:Uncharacterized protein n=1 Tax=Caerostris extrusa TaxID=172846 RepID=A0AAV4N034_CAEEX|nr:hypothetical protein CEXT_134041 [Caerostris extrusa]